MQDFHWSWPANSSTPIISISASWDTPPQEKLDEWEVVDTPDAAEMAGFHGTESPLPPQMRTTHPEDRGQGSLDESTGSNAEHSGHIPDAVNASASQRGHVHQNDTHPSKPMASQETKTTGGKDTSLDPSPPTSKRNKRDTGPELYPCGSCNSYHYTVECIYLLPWTEWLEYHHNFMSSQPYPFSHNDTPVDASEHLALKKKAAELDRDHSDNHRPNYLASSRLKADLMTHSSREMWREDEAWRRRQVWEKRKAMLGSSVAAVPKKSGKTAWTIEEEDSEDELSREERIEDARVEFEKYLPRTSTATLGKKWCHRPEFCS